MIKISRSRLRLLDFVSTSMSRPKSLNRDLKILAFLDSLSWSRSAWIFVFSRRDFSIRRDFSSFWDSKGFNNVEISWQISTASRQILTASRQILTSLDWKILILKISTEKKKVDLDRWENLNNSKKLVLTRRTFSISIGLDCRDPQA